MDGKSVFVYSEDMKIGIVLQSNNHEHVWNVFRFSITALKGSHTVTIFLLNEGTELESMADTEEYDISKKIVEYRALGGEILACGTCLKSRGKSGSDVCPVSTMGDLLALVEASDKVMVFS